MTRFGDFAPLCRHTPSYPWCNLFYHQLQAHGSQALTGLSADAKTAPVGIDPICGILPAGINHSVANIANIVACALSIIFIIGLILLASRRKAAVGLVEFRAFLILYLFTVPLQLITTGSFLEQGSNALVVLTAIHAGAVAATFWLLLGNAIVSTQVVEDGTLSSMIPLSFFTLAFFAATTYISLDVGFTFTHVFGPSSPPQDLHSIPLFILTSVWPGVAALVYLGLMVYIVLGMLNEIRPAWYFVIAAVLFVLSQLDYFLLSGVICNGSSSKVDGSFIATILETAAVGVLYLAWKSITEEDWDNDIYFPR